MLHDLPAIRENVHWGYFDAALAPALVVESGDFVRTEAITHHAGDAPELMMDEKVRALYETIPESDREPGVHLMTGPIFVKDAKPGDLLEVRYLQMIPRFNYGSNLAAHWGHLFGDFEKERVTIYELDQASNTAHALYAYDYPGKYLVPGKRSEIRDCCRELALEGIRVPVRPHLGTAGVAPDVAGRVSTVPPGAHGGNIDNWRIGAGSTMYYPVAVDGGLFSIGDPHVSQGDGEISGTALESSLNGLLRLTIRRDLPFTVPVLETSTELLVHGFGDSLDAAMKCATLRTLQLLQCHYGLSRADAYSFMSVAVDYTVTQVVDQRQGVHGRIDKRCFPRWQNPAA